MILRSISFVIFLGQVQQYVGVSKINKKNGLTELCLVNISPVFINLMEFSIYLSQVNDESKIMESEGIGNKEACQKYCQMTENCYYWSWYKRHCDK